MIYDTDRMDSYGNIVEILDETKPGYDYEKLKKTKCRKSSGLVHRKLLQKQRMTVWSQSHWLREYRQCWRQRGANYEDNRTDPEEFR